MRYIFLLYHNETALAQMTEAEMGESLAKNQAVCEEAAGKGVLAGVGALMPTSMATTVRMNGDELMATDGPFAETKEQLGGYYILDCADLDEAMEWARKMPACAGGSVEIRPMIELPG